MAKRAGKPREILCYLCGHRFEVSEKAMSTTCPKCHKAIKVEDLVVKTYVPVNDLQTCGKIRVTKRGRVAAKRVQCGGRILIEGTIEGEVSTEEGVRVSAKGSWRGRSLRSATLEVVDGAQLEGFVEVPRES